MSKSLEKMFAIKITKILIFITHDWKSYFMLTNNKYWTDYKNEEYNFFSCISTAWSEQKLSFNWTCHMRRFLMMNYNMSMSHSFRVNWLAAQLITNISTDHTVFWNSIRRFVFLIRSKWIETFLRFWLMHFFSFHII